MKPIKVIAVTLLAGTISIGAAIVGQRWVGEAPLLEGLIDRNTERLQTRPDFRLLDIDGHEHASSEWAGKVLVLNFWATWCAPCVEELPILARAQAALADERVQFVGIAVDSAEDVKEFVAKHQVSFPVLIADAQAVDLAKRLGNRLEVLPFTVIFDSHGRRAHSQMGEMTEEELYAQLGRLDGGAAKL